MPDKEIMPFLRSKILIGEQESAKIAHLLAKLLRGGLYLSLEGQCGSGKTCFMRFLIRALLGDENFEVTSPSFNLVQYYDKGLTSELAFAIIHADLYRLTDAGELLELGLMDNRAQSLLAIEWAQNAQQLLPMPDIILSFAYLPALDAAYDKARRLTLKLSANLYKEWADLPQFAALIRALS